MYKSYHIEIVKAKILFDQRLCITLWTIWIERTDKVFSNTQWHESKVKQRIWDELIIYAKVAWNRVIEQIKISSFSLAAMH